MINFKYTPRDYVSNFSLERLENTANTLEQGHKEAIKTASQLESTILSYDLNEAEDEWRNQKLNEIKEIVDKGTVYGNSYGALDNLIANATKLTLGRDMTGRLQAQKDYKQFKNSIESDRTLTDVEKEYYLENNPYSYKDKYDNKGNVIGGSVWEPNIRPTEKVDISSLITKAISITAKDSGVGKITRWLDKNGNITTNYKEAFDGEVYNETTTSWERLSADDIWKTFNSLVDTTPGAKESIKRDYDIAKWKHNKDVKSNNNKPIISGITDDNGFILSEKDYLFKRVNPAIQEAAYNKSNSNTTYGNGLKSYLAVRNAYTNGYGLPGSNIGMSTNGYPNNPNKKTQLSISADGNVIKIDNTYNQNLFSSRENLWHQIHKICGELTGKKGFVNIENTDLTLDRLKKFYGDASPKLDNNIELKNLLEHYANANNALKDIMANMTPEDKKEFNASLRFMNGGRIVNSSKGGTKYDDNIIKSINALFDNKDTIEIDLTPETMTNFVGILNNSSYNDINELGVSVDEENGKVFIPKTAKNVLPMLASIMKKSESRATLGFINTGLDYFTDHIRINKNDLKSEFEKHLPKKITNNALFDIALELNPITRIAGRVKNFDDNARQKIFYELAENYDDAIQKYEEISKKYELTSKSVPVKSLTLDGNTFTEQYLLEQVNKGLMSEQEYNNNVKYYNDSFNNVISSVNFTANPMYYSDEGNAMEEVIKSEDRFNFGEQIKNAVKDKRATFAPTIVPGHTDMYGSPIFGYTVTISPALKSDGSLVNEDDKVKTFYIPNLVNETASEMLRNDSAMKANAEVHSIGYAKGNKYYFSSGSTPSLGVVSLKGLGVDKYEFNFGGLTNNITTTQAVGVANAMNDYKAIKNIIEDVIYNSTESITKKDILDSNERLRRTLANCAITVSSITGTNPEAMLSKLIENL